MDNNTAQDSGQDRERNEEDLAGGPVSRGASNQSAPINQVDGSADPTAASQRSGDNDEQYNKLVDSNGGETGATTNRDLGTVGGGSIPGGNAYRGMNASSDTAGSPSASAKGAPNDRGSTSVPGMHESPGAPNASDQPQQGTLGGRNPGQTQNQPIGDQDTTFGHRDSTEDQIGDPMTSRAPDKVNQPAKQDS